MAYATMRPFSGQCPPRGHRPFLSMKKGRKIILASQSPARRELLGRLHIPFETQIPHVDEEQVKEEQKNKTGEQIAQTLADLKAKTLEKNSLKTWSSAPTKFWNGKTLFYSKPLTPSKAIAQLQQLAGQTHRLITAVCLRGGQKSVRFIQVAHLTMRPLEREEIVDYIQREAPLQCVGSYKIESEGIKLFEKIHVEDFTAIIGLPLIELTTHLRQMGYLPQIS